MSSAAKIALSFATVCFAWGASYFAIKIGLLAMPPLTMGAIRYGSAGLILWIWCQTRSHEPLTGRQWAVAAFNGICFVAIGNGTILWAEQTVPSSLVAMLVAITPVNTLLLEWFLRTRSRPGAMTWVGLMLALAGVVLLAAHPGAGSARLFPIFVVLLGTLGWSLGSALSTKLDRPLSPLRGISSQMLAGAAVLAVLSGALGEWHQVHPARFTWPALAALMYLIFVASIAAYIAYGYLMVNVSPTAAGACAYVNPVVALLLGAIFGERVGGKEVLALGAVLAGVSLISIQELRRVAGRVRAPSKAPQRSEELLEACAL